MSLMVDDNGGMGWMHSLKIGFLVAASTVTTSGFHITHVIPNNIGWVAALCGAVLSLVLCYTHIKRSIVESRKMKLETMLLEEKVKAARDANDDHVID